MSVVSVQLALFAVVRESVSALFSVLFIGWFAPKGTLRDQITNNGSVATRLYPTINFIVRWIAPLLILLILLQSVL